MAAKSRQASQADKKSGTRKRSTGLSAKVQDLVDAGCLTPEVLSDKVLKAIEDLNPEDVEALKRVNNKVSLSAFFKARGPQEGGG